VTVPANVRHRVELEHMAEIGQLEVRAASDRRASIRIVARSA
jgi:hypothetical protein